MRRSVELMEDEEASSPSATENRRVDQKGNALRSKHSETEQRRRSKINERFQILRDLIPENDQKRDKASFLLEVIAYIQFLHEKLQMHEGSCHDWNPGQRKLEPWKINSGPVESHIDQSHLERQLSGHEDLNTTLLRDTHPTIDSDFTGATLYRPPDTPPMATNQVPLNMPFQAPIIETVTGQPHQNSFPDAEQLTEQSRSHFWREDDYSVPLCTANEDELKGVVGESSLSSACSQGLLISLRSALQSSGVDLSQANISVQLDVRKRTNGQSAQPTFHTKEHENHSGLITVSPGNIIENYEHPQKKFRAY